MVKDKDLARLRIRKSSRVVEPKNCIGCLFRYYSGGGDMGLTCCTIYERTGRLPKPDRSGRCLNKIVSRDAAKDRWRAEGARRLKK